MRVLFLAGLVVVLLAGDAHARPSTFLHTPYTPPKAQPPHPPLAPSPVQPSIPVSIPDVEEKVPPQAQTPYLAPPVPTLTALPDPLLVHFVDANAGNDTSNPGTSASPWKTIGKCASVAATGDFCVIRNGTYRETVIPPRDGVTYMADTGASPVISGADLITGWVSSSGNIYKSSGMTWTMGVGNDQILVDGQMMMLARWPNATGNNPMTPVFSTSQSSGGHPTASEATGDFNPWILVDSALPGGSWVGAEVTFENSFVLQSGVVTASSAGQLTFTNLQSPEERSYQTNMTGSYRYYLSNVLNALDTAGEWFFDTSTNTLYLWTLANDTPANHTVEAKHRKYAIQLTGRNNVIFKNVKVVAAAITTDANSGSNVFDGITATYVWQQGRNIPPTVIVSENFPPNPSKDAVWAGFGSGIFLDGQSNTFRNGTVSWSSNDGLYLHGNNQLVTNTTVHDVNWMGVDSALIGWQGSQAHYVPPIGVSNIHASYNTMYNAGRHGVLSLGQNFVVGHNIIHDVCQIVQDCGVTYAFNQDTGNLNLSGEWSYNIGYGVGSSYAAKGYYLDGSSASMLLHHNVFYQTGGRSVDEGIMIQDTVADTNIYNNTIFNANAIRADIGNEGSMTNIVSRNNCVQTGPVSGTTTDHNVTGTTSSDFVSAPTNMQLTSGSQCRNAGTTIPAITTTFTDTNPAAGAYEFGQPAWGVGASTIAAAVTSPTSQVIYSTASSPMAISGTANDTTGITGVTWSNARGGSGNATCASCSPTTPNVTWSIPSVALQSGDNTITVTAQNANGNVATTYLVVALVSPTGSKPALLQMFHKKSR